MRVILALLRCCAASVAMMARLDALCACSVPLLRRMLRAGTLRLAWWLRA